MKGLLVANCLLLFSLSSAGQVYFGYAYTGNTKSLKGLNQFVDNYNTSRTWLDKEMKDFGYLDGFTINFGAGIGAFWVDMEYNILAQKRIASGISPLNGQAYRQLKLRNNNFAFTTGVMAAESEGGVAFGLRTEFGGQKTLTRVFADKSDKGDWDKSDSELTLNAGPMMKIFIAPDAGAYFAISLYYTWGFGLFNTNHTYLDRQINNVNHIDDSPDFENKLHSFGFSISAGVFGG